MAIKIVDASKLDAALTATAGAIRTKTGGSAALAFDLQNETGFAAAVGAIPSGGGSPALQEKTATQNGIVLPDSGYDGLSKVTVNVSGGGGVAVVRCRYPLGKTSTATDGVTSLTSDQSGEYLFILPNAGTWTFSCDGDTKQVVISANDILYTAVGGATYLPVSDRNAILAEADFRRWTSSEASSFGGLALLGGVNFTKNADQSVNMNGNQQEAYYDLGAANVSVTNYMLSKSLSSESAKRLIINANSESTGNCPGFFRSGSRIYTTIFTGDTDTGVSALDWHLMAITVNNTAKKVRYFIDGVYLYEKSFNNSGRYSEFTATYIHGNQSYGDNTDVKYIAVVSGAESDQTVIANMQNIMSEYGLS